MFNQLHKNTGLQLKIGLLVGIVFGFLLQRGGVTRYDVIIGQLLLQDWTVVKVMLTAVITGTLGIHWLRSLGKVNLHPKPGGWGMSAIGGLIFGVGFGVLGYCPGTLAGAVGQGSLDALFGGVVGMLIGAGLFAAVYPRLREGILSKGTFTKPTLPEVFNVDPWVVVVPVAVLIGIFLWVLETLGY
ncbi:YeeE/YedE family protein [candidate division KSB3 bacterium]|uniref:YeeE/YedE family protein n=1 Tax=candidate division KSB3 bacterium TaxID=2044937 RepID=A0A9D5Q4S3_9BACT|nr:YeeE/YedE family protein [candidate division KSB3 bacterium]MBD3323593.1 YeeE/YedE family protein [candidate division KSB3 bacterium]